MSARRRSRHGGLPPATACTRLIDERWRILVTAGDFGEGDSRAGAMLRAAAGVLMRGPYPRPARAWGLVPLVGEVQGIIAGGDEFSRRVLEAAPRLQVIARHGGRAEGIAVEAATDLGIIVSHTPGADADAVAELSFTLLLAVARQIPAGDRIARREAGRGGRLARTGRAGAPGGIAPNLR